MSATPTPQEIAAQPWTDELRQQCRNRLDLLQIASPFQIRDCLAPCGLCRAALTDGDTNG
jgi:hypothetical protein